jgi:hypothetical protein
MKECGGSYVRACAASARDEHRATTPPKKSDATVRLRRQPAASRLRSSHRGWKGQYLQISREAVECGSEASMGVESSLHGY